MLTGVTAEASERRTQLENKGVAIRRLRRTLAVEIRSVVEDREPSELWRSRVKNRKIVLSESHDDHPAMLAEAIDRLAANDWDLAATAEQFGTTASQLVKLLKSEPRAFKQLNDERSDRGLASMK